MYTDICIYARFHYLKFFKFNEESRRQTHEPLESLRHFFGKFSILPSVDGISTLTIYGIADAAKVCA